MKTQDIRLSAASSGKEWGLSVRTGDHDSDAFALYLREMRRLPLLSAEEEHALAVRASAGDAEAKARLVEANLRLVIRLARCYTGRGLDLLDLIQEGNLGLLHAVERFDAGSGHRLSTYAYSWIGQAISRAVEGKGTHIRLPGYVHQSLRRVKQARRELLEVLGREPTVEELAETAGTDAMKLKALLEMSRPTRSLDEPVYGEAEETPLAEVLPDTRSATLEEQVSQAQLHEALLSALGHLLTPREYAVIRLRFGLEQQACHTQSQASRLLGITRERVRQLEASALVKLRRCAWLR